MERARQWTGLLVTASALAILLTPAFADACAGLGDGCCDSTSSGVCECGDEVRSSVTLTQDVICAANPLGGRALAVVTSGAILRLDGRQVVCTSPSSGCGAATGIRLDAATTTVQGPGVVKGFLHGVGSSSVYAGTVAKRLIVLGTGVTSTGRGIGSVVTVDSNQVANFTTGILYAGIWGSTTVTSPDVIDNLVTQSKFGIEVDNAGTATYPRLYHNRLVANAFGLSFLPNALFNAATGCGDGCGVSEHNVVTQNSTADVYDESVQNLDLARNVCFTSWTGTCLNNGAQCQVDADCPPTPAPQACSVLTNAGPCSASPILPSWSTFEP